jgi:DNA-binding NtrC family response regulator
MTTVFVCDEALQAIKLGAYNYITKPFPKVKLLTVLERLLDHHRLANENLVLRKELQRGTGRAETMVFRSARFREVYDLTLQVASSDANILILGESGTGKELIANTITAALLPIGRRRLPAAVPKGAPPLVALDVVERQHIKGVLKRTGFHKSRTAEILGISRKTLDRKIVEFALNAGRPE